MSLPPAYLSQKLVQLLPTKNGGVLRTIGDAVTYMLALSPDRGGTLGDRMWRSYRGPPIKQSLKRCTLSCPMWLFPSVPSGSSLPTNARHSFSNDDLCAAYEGAANAMSENTSRMVLISNLQGVSALVMSAS